MYAGLGKALGSIRIDPPARTYADFEILEFAPGVATRGLEPVDASDCCLDIEREAEPSARQARTTGIRLFGVTAEDDLWMRLLHRPRHRVNAAEVDEPPVILGLFHAPKRDHRG